MSRTRTAIEIINEFKKMEKEHASADFWTVNRLLTGIKGPIFNFAGTDLCLANTDGDYGSVEEWRVVVEWMAKELGGHVAWADEEDGAFYE